MKKMILISSGIILLTFSLCQASKEVANSNNTVKVFQFSTEPKQYLFIGNKGNTKYYCENEIMFLQNGKEIQSKKYLKLIEDSWIFTPITQADSSLMPLLGEVTPDFYIDVYQNKIRLFGISVYFDKDHIIGIYHTKLGKMKPVRKELPCFYFKYLSM